MAEVEQRVLIYDRIDANRRATRLLLAAFAAVLLPVAAYLAMYLMEFVAVIVGVFIASSGLGDAFSGDEDSLAAFAAAVVTISLLILLLLAYIQFRFASAIVLRLAGARPVSREAEPELWRAVENVSIGAGLPHPRLYVVETAPANAFSTGLNPGSSSLVVTRGLLTLLDRRELEGVLAHEIAQIGNHDTRLGTVMAVGVALLRLPLGVAVAVFRLLFRIHWAVGAGLLLYLGLPLLASIPFAFVVAGDLLEEDLLVGAIFIASLVLPFYAFLVAPLLAYIIRRMVLRRREFLADADAVLLTRYAEGLARALAKMGAARTPLTTVGGATAHLYLVDPLPPDAPIWERLFSTHPPIEERIAVLAGMGGGIAPSILQSAEEAGARFATAAPAVDPTGPSGEGPTRERARRTEAFRLTGAGATLYAAPDAASEPLTELIDGALVTVVGEDGDFLRVLTTDDSFGYIARSTPMSEVDLNGTTAA